MAERSLHLDPALGHDAGPVPADLAEGLATDGTPLVLQHDPILASLPPPISSPVFDWGQALASLHDALMGIVPLLQWFFLLYFIAYNGSYIMHNLMSLSNLVRNRREQGVATLFEDDPHGELPVSLIVPICGRADIAAAVHAMLRLDYSEFEIIVVNDGMRDEILDALIREFSLVPFPEAYRDRLPTRPVKSIYASPAYPNLRLVDKIKGGKADALNAGINCARYPLFCGLDAAVALQRESLRKMGQPFVGSPATVAACSVVRIANGCMSQNGFVNKIGLPPNMIVLFQIVEKLRAFLPGRAWWRGVDAMLALPGVFTMYRKEAVVAAGGYRTDVVDEEMELMARLHRLLRQAREAYRISLVPDPVCWAVVPDAMGALIIQQVRQQRGLSESLATHHQLLFDRRYGLAFFFMLLFEWLGPLFELLGYVVMTAMWLSGAISQQMFDAFLLLAIGLGMLLSVSGLVVEDLSLRYYPRLGNVVKLFVVALLENLGYRQVAACWRLLGQQRWILRSEAK